MEQSDRPNRTEDQFTKTIEDYTAAIPSSTYLAVAIGAMALSLMCQAAGQGKWGELYRSMGADVANHRGIQQTGQTGRP
jgi:hypothetical protein